MQLKAITVPLAIVMVGASGLAVYALDRGVFVGSSRYVTGADCCPDLDYIQKRCRYLFVTGISEIDAIDGTVDAPNARKDRFAVTAAMNKPENGYCHLFAPNEPTSR
jgi:hypothetical protein